MASHSRPWDDTTPAIGDDLGNGYAEINNLSDDVNDRMQLEHEWAASTIYDGVHKPGLSAVVGNLDTAADIIANQGVFLAAYNGSTRMASDTDVLYVKVGPVNSAAGGTWTAISTVRVAFGTRAITDSLGATLIKNAIYRVGSDGFINASAHLDNNWRLKLYTGANNPPTDKLGDAGGEDSANWGSVAGPIKEDDYVKVSYTGTSAPLIYWLPIGTGTCVKQ